MPIDSLDALLLEGIRDLYDAEKQLTKALPKLAKASDSQDLKAAFTEHLEQTKGHVSRLESVFEHLGVKAKGKPCAAMKGLVEEGQEQTQEDAEGPYMDLLLIAAAQKVEHYEISGYGSMRAIAEAVGNEDVADLLRQTEEEESETDEKLTGIAEGLMAEIGDSGEEEEEGDEEAEEEEEEEEVETVPARATKKTAATKKR
jgi:ferritin-like metal-binding protein YciE